MKKRLVALVLVLLLLAVSVSALAYAQISSTSRSLNFTGSNTLHATASTTATEMADNVGGTVFLQRQNPDTLLWSSINTKVFTKLSATSASWSYDYSVASGYNYRLRVAHFVEDGGEGWYITKYSGVVTMP